MAWIVHCVHEQFCVAIALYVLDGVDSEAGTAMQRKVHGKHRISEYLLSSLSAAACTLKHTCLHSSVALARVQAVHAWVMYAILHADGCSDLIALEEQH